MPALGRRSASSVPESFTNATVDLAVLRLAARDCEVRAERCRHVLLELDAGDVGAAAGSCSRRARGAPSGGRRRASSPSQAGSTSAAVSALTTISPAVARSSSSKTRVAAGPGDEQLAVRRVGEEEMAVARSGRRPTSAARPARPSSRRCPICSIVHCMSEAAPAARCAWRVTAKKSSSASPRNFSTSPPCRSATSIRPSKHGRDAPDELLGAGPALRRQPLRERGESGDVDGDERAVARRGIAARPAPRSRRGRAAGGTARAAISVRSASSPPAIVVRSTESLCVGPGFIPCKPAAHASHC